MNSFTTLFKKSISIVFRDQETFWTLFLLMNGVNIVITITFHVLGYNISNQQDLQRMMQEITPYLVFMISSTIFGGFFGFIGLLYLANVCTAEKVELKSIFSQWKKIFPYIGTLFCMLLCYIGIWLGVMVIFGITFGVGYLAYTLTLGMGQGLLGVLYIIGGIIGFLIAAATIFTAIWLAVSLYTFFIPAFFLDHVKYFQAPLNSKKIISGRWWSVAGKIFLGSLIILIVPIFLSLTQQFFHVSNIALTFAILIFNGLAGIVLMSFLFLLYINCKENPVVITNKIK